MIESRRHRYVLCLICRTPARYSDGYPRRRCLTIYACFRCCPTAAAQYGNAVAELVVFPIFSGEQCLKRIKIILVTFGVVMALVCLPLFVTGTWWRMRTQFNLGEEALRRGKLSGAVRAMNQPCACTLPGHPALFL